MSRSFIHRMIGFLALFSVFGPHLQAPAQPVGTPVTRHRNQEDSNFVTSRWFDLGTYHLLHDSWDESLKAFREALRYATDDGQRSAIHQNLGSISFLMAEYQKAALHFEHAYHLLPSRVETDPRRAEICLNLGFTFLEREDPERASAWFSMAGQSAGSGSFTWALRTALGGGNLLFLQGNYRGAIDCYDKALELCSDTTPILTEEVWLRKNRAWSDQARGLTGSALATVERALERVRGAENLDPLHESEILLQQAILLEESGNHAGAVASLDDALGRIPRLLPATAGQGEGEPPLTTVDLLRYRILGERALATWRLNAVRTTTHDSLIPLQEEVDRILVLGERLAGTERIRELMALDPGIQRSLTGLAMELSLRSVRDGNQDVDHAVALTMRLGRFESLCESDPQSEPGGLPDTVRSGLHLLKKQLFTLHKQYLLERKDTGQARSDRTSTWIRTLARLDSLERVIEADQEDSGAGGEVVPDDSLTDGSVSIISMLTAGEALIRFLWCDTSLFVLVFTSDTAYVWTQTAGRRLGFHIRACKRSLAALDPTGFRHHSASLYRLLIGPIAWSLQGRNRLHIIPDGDLRRLPFDALVTSPESDREGGDEYLISGNTISCYASISSWLRHRGYTGGDRERHFFPYELLICTPEFSTPGAEPLPHAWAEVDQISDLFRMKNRDVHVLKGRALNECSFLTAARQSRIIHLATHGVSDPVHPELSGWILPGDPGPSPGPGYPDNALALGALQTLDLHSDLMVLSACPVNPLLRKGWYRMTGFPENFFRSGVANIIFSLWDVSDPHTRVLMYSFYREVLAGASYSAALRKAKLALLREPETSFPALWAAFVLWSD